MKKPYLVVLLILVAISSYAQPEKELDEELNAAAKIVFLDAIDFKNSLIKKDISYADLQQMESYHTETNDHCRKLWQSDNKIYAKYGYFLNTVMEIDLALVYAWNNEAQKAHDQLISLTGDLEKYDNDNNFFPFRFKVGDMNYTVPQSDIKGRLFDCYKALGVTCGMLKMWEESKLYWHVILRIPRLPAKEIYFANKSLITIKENTDEQDIELLDAYLKNFRILSYTKKDRRTIPGYVDPNELYNAAKALSDKHPEFGRSFEIDTTGAKDFFELGDYGKSAELFTKWLEGDIGSVALASWGIFVGIEMKDTKLVNLAIKNLEKGNWTGYCFAFQMLKEGYEFLGNNGKARYWRKKDDKCMGR